MRLYLLAAYFVHYLRRLYKKQIMIQKTNIRRHQKKLSKKHKATSVVLVKTFGRTVLITTKKSSFKNDFLVCRLIIFQFFTLQFHISRSIFQFKCSVSPKENEKYKVCNQCFHFYSPYSSLLLSLLNENVSCSNCPKLS